MRVPVDRFDAAQKTARGAFRIESASAGTEG